mmetsp:Transcript_10482/g.23566  ORF Transcript_10482/g.23566 Transcript_10482/m.23566 type:complete len:299 (-) Transcript_10482:93-989(-)|eukprot:CAMPEP_0170609624 /NCGR_PEP_ID=MMETSP0224-20130122/22225_1 /TAXON_ID=285029 /ORGANISM="Togula jolla, Strain CCCM 725" /LENGTH=298 /DNA_ID=CAMNT_0010934945 /DNA_START=68 /DNA_END=967 /DNA_ORIENTATION=+
MPRRRMCVGCDSTDDSGDQGSWVEIFKKTKMCRAHVTGSCRRGQACAFAHDVEALRPLPNFRLTKMCRAFRRSGFCDKGDSCGFAHSSEEVRGSSATVMQPMMPLQEDPTQQGRVSGDPDGLHDQLHPMYGNVDLTPTSSLNLRHTWELEEAKVKMNAACEDIWSRQTTAQATSNGWSRQTSAQEVQEEDELMDRWSRQIPDQVDFNASYNLGFQDFLALQVTTCLDSGQGGRIFNSRGDDASSDRSSRADDLERLELRVQNTFLAALPRGRCHRRASSMPSSGGSLAKSFRSSTCSS